MLKQLLKKRIILKSKVFFNDPLNSKGMIYSITTAIAVAQINYHFINPVIATILLMMVVTHEYAHYVYAKSSGAKTRHPFFLPFPYIIIGVTNAQDVPVESKPSVALAGFSYGSVFILLFALLNIIFNFVNFYFLLFLLCTEIIFNYFGSDGKKYRQSKNEVIL